MQFKHFTTARQGCRPRKQASGLSKGTAVSFEARAIACHVCIPLPRYLYMYLRGWRYYRTEIMQSWYGKFQSSAVLKRACVPGAVRWQPNRSVRLWRTTCYCGSETMIYGHWMQRRAATAMILTEHHYRRQTIMNKTRPSRQNNVNDVHNSAKSWQRAKRTAFTACRSHPKIMVVGADALWVAQCG